MYFRALVVMTLAVLLAGCSVWTMSRPVMATDAIAAEALNYAMSRIGDPYVWGGQSPGGFDCSGLIIWAYKQAYPELQLVYAGEKVADTTQDGLWRYNVQPILPETMRPGDIVFITSDPTRMTHGGLFIEWVDEGMTEFRFVNASSYHGEVVIDTWPLHGEKRGQWFAGAGRLLVVR